MESSLTGRMDIDAPGAQIRTMPSLSKLLQRNRKWAETLQREQPAFFRELALDQHPDYLWIGCSDSRVSADQIMGLRPGEIFVHRNIANVFVHTDLNLLSVLDYAVNELKVGHVIVAGHYGCGGVRAAMDRKASGLIENWLRHIQDVEDVHMKELTPLHDVARFDRLCELNVLAQVDKLRRSPVLRDAWARGQKLELHSWIYSMENGRLTPLQDVIASDK